MGGDRDFLQVRLHRDDSLQTHDPHQRQLGSDLACFGQPGERGRETPLGLVNFGQQAEGVSRAERATFQPPRGEFHLLEMSALQIKIPER